LSKHRLFASIMAADYAHLAEDVAGAVEAGVDGFHFDIMDGNFVPNITFGADLVRALRPLTDLPFDAHLMVTNPDLFIPQMAEAGVNRISIHPEVWGHLQRSLTYIRELGAQPGVALNPSTAPQNMEYVLDDIDYVLVMSVNPGFSGQKFIPSARRKLEELSKLIAASGRDVRIMLDGSVVPENIADLARLGASDFVTGVPLFGHRPLIERVREYREALA
jgi:ribulose-phosphate 3-epimerase